MSFTFKTFIVEQKTRHTALEKWEDLLHHIAEEELVACKVFEIKLGKRASIHFIADCNDDPRQEGLQRDLSKKLTARLAKHQMPGLGKIIAKVFHKNVDPR